MSLQRYEDLGVDEVGAAEVDCFGLECVVGSGRVFMGN
jgi:hypothetical protein